jgi:long-chain acyl-CoA synthetase
MAVVEPLPDAQPDIDGIRRYLAHSFTGFKLPRRIEIRERLPREDSGKIFKRALRAPYWEGTGRAI